MTILIYAQTKKHLTWKELAVTVVIASFLNIIIYSYSTLYFTVMVSNLCDHVIPISFRIKRACSGGK